MSRITTIKPTQINKPFKPSNKPNKVNKVNKPNDTNDTKQTVDCLLATIKKEQLDKRNNTGGIVSLTFHGQSVSTVACKKKTHEMGRC